MARLVPAGSKPPGWRCAAPVCSRAAAFAAAPTTVVAPSDGVAADGVAAVAAVDDGVAADGGGDVVGVEKSTATRTLDEVSTCR